MIDLDLDDLNQPDMDSLADNSGPDTSESDDTSQIQNTDNSDEITNTDTDQVQNTATYSNDASNTPIDPFTIDPSQWEQDHINDASFGNLHNMIDQHVQDNQSLPDADTMNNFQSAIADKWGIPTTADSAAANADDSDVNADAQPDTEDAQPLADQPKPPEQIATDTGSMSDASNDVRNPNVQNQLAGTGNAVTAPLPSATPPTPQTGQGTPQHPIADGMMQRIKDAEQNGEFISTGADAGSKQCVALVKAAHPELGRAQDWVQGDPVTPDNTTLKPGDAIARGWVDGKYPNKSTGNHAAIVTGVSRDKNGRIENVTIAEQWGVHPKSLDGQPVTTTILAPEGFKHYSTINHP